MKGIKLDGIKLNFKYKNLKEICKITGFEYKDSTNSRKKIIKELERFMKLEKDGRGYIVKEIYSTPKEKVDGRKTGRTGEHPNSHGNNTEGKYGKYIDPILIDYFQNCIQNEIYVMYSTTNILAKQIGIINHNFKTCNNFKNQFKFLINKENNIKITNTSFYNVFIKINELKRKPIISSLDRLQKRGLINYRMSYIIYYKFENRIAYFTEEEEIKKIIKEANKKYEVDNFKIMNNEKLKNKYYEYITEETKKKIEECDGIYIGFKIIINEKILNEKNNDVKKLKKDLNKIIIKEVRKKMFKNKKKVEDEYKNTLGIINPNIKKHEKEILDINYIVYTDIVIDYLLNLNKKDITEDIKKMVNNYKKIVKDVEWLVENY